MSEETQITAGDLTTEHYGLMVRFEDRTAVVDELRRWVHQGQRRVEIIDLTPSGSFAGTGHHLGADAPVTLLRRIRKARKRPWGKSSLRPGETWEELER